MFKSLVVNKRKRVLFVIIISSIVVLSGVATILAKTGVVNFSIFADSLSSNASQTVTITVKSRSTTGSTGVGYAFVEAKRLKSPGYESADNYDPTFGNTDKDGKWNIKLHDGLYDFSAAYSSLCKAELGSQQVSSLNKNFTLIIDCTGVSSVDNYYIVGKATDTNKKPLQDVLISAKAKTKIDTYTAMSGVDGIYVINIPPSEDNYNLIGSKEGYEMKDGATVYSSASVNNRIVNLMYDPVVMKKIRTIAVLPDVNSYKISGKLRADTGLGNMPVRKARILITNQKTSVSYQSYSDNNGDFVISNITPSDGSGNYFLSSDFTIQITKYSSTSATNQYEVFSKTLDQISVSLSSKIAEYDSGPILLKFADVYTNGYFLIQDQSGQPVSGESITITATGGCETELDSWTGKTFDRKEIKIAGKTLSYNFQAFGMLKKDSVPQNKSCGYTLKMENWNKYYFDYLNINNSYDSGEETRLLDYSDMTIDANQPYYSAITVKQRVSDTLAFTANISLANNNFIPTEQIYIGFDSNIGNCITKFDKNGNAVCTVTLNRKDKYGKIVNEFTGKFLIGGKSYGIKAKANGVEYASSIQFSNGDIKWDSDSKSYYYQNDYVVNVGNSYIDLDFSENSTSGSGLIDFDKMSGINTSLELYTVSGTNEDPKLERAASTSSWETSPTTNHAIRYYFDNYTVPTNGLNVAAKVSFESSSYIYLFDQAFVKLPATITLVKKDKLADFYICKSYDGDKNLSSISFQSGVKICEFRDVGNSGIEYSVVRKYNLVKYLYFAKKISGVENEVKVFVLPNGYLNPKRASLASADLFANKGLGNDNRLFVDYITTGTLDFAEYTEDIFESSFFKSALGNKFWFNNFNNNIEKTLSQMGAQTCKSGTSRLNSNQGSTKFEFKANNITSYELFSRSFGWWFLYNRDFKEAVNYTADANCQNLYSYLYEWMHESFQGLDVYEKINNVSKSNDDKIKLASAVVSNSTDIATLNKLMSELLSANLFQKITTVNGISSVTDITVASLSADQILNGEWQYDNYDRLTNMSKIKMQYGIMLGKISEAISSSPSSKTIKAVVSKLNSAFNDFLIKLNIKKDLATVKGRVTDQLGNGVSDLVVGGCNKIATTDNNGNYVISNIPLAAGTQCKIDSIKDSHSGESYKIVNNQSINIAKSKTTTANISIQYSLALVKGKLTTNAGNPVAGAKLSFRAGKTNIETTTDDDGYYTVSGLGYKKYTVLIKNKNNSLIRIKSGSSFTADRNITVSKSGFREFNLDITGK